MKIFFYINVLGGGGAERVMANLTAQFLAAGHEVGLITTLNEPDAYPLDARVQRLVLEEGERKGNVLTRNLDRIRKLRHIVKQQRADVLISFLEEPNFRNLLATAGLKTKSILSVRNDPNREYPTRLSVFLAKRLFRRADGIVFQTADAQAWFPPAVQKRSVIIPNQVNPCFYRQALSKERHHVVTVGRLSPQKNHLGLIRAFARIRDRVQEDLIIYGEGELRQELEAEIARLGLGGRVHLPGSVSQIEDKLAQAKLFVLSSDFEGMPNALMEAMAMGLPCISTDCPCGGPRMLMEKGSEGILVPVGDEEMLAQAMEALLEQPETAQQFGAAAKERAEAFRPEAVFARWEAYVRQVVGR